MEFNFYLTKERDYKWRERFNLVKYPSQKSRNEMIYLKYINRKKFLKKVANEEVIPDVLVLILSHITDLIGIYLFEDCKNHIEIAYGRSYDDCNVIEITLSDDNNFIEWIEKL